MLVCGTAISRNIRPEEVTAMIVFVDDEVFVLNYIKAHMRGYDVPTAYCHSVAEAKATIDHHASEVQLVITDLHMPDEDGYQLLDWLEIHYPDLPKLVLTAHSQEQALKESLSAYKHFCLLRKPITVETELIPVIDMILKQNR